MKKHKFSTLFQTWLKEGVIRVYEYDNQSRYRDLYALRDLVVIAVPHESLQPAKKQTKL
jgi:hypothetical protein